MANEVSEKRKVKVEEYIETFGMDVAAELFGSGTLKGTVVTSKLVDKDEEGFIFDTGAVVVIIPQEKMFEINKRWDIIRNQREYRTQSEGSCVYRLKETGKNGKGFIPETTNLFSFNVTLSAPHIGYTSELTADERRKYEEGLAKHIADLLNMYPYNPL